MNALDLKEKMFLQKYKGLGLKKAEKSLDQLAQGVEMDGGMSVTEDELVQITLDNPSNGIKKKTRNSGDAF